MFELDICDIRKARGLCFYWATKTISLLDPGTDMGFKPYENHIILFFNDKCYSSNQDDVLATKEHLRKIFAFSDSFTDEDRVLIHCHMGLGRSTAVAIGVLIHHKVPFTEAFERVKAIRPLLWPNDLIISMIDEMFGLGSELTQLVLHHKQSGFGFVTV